VWTDCGLGLLNPLGHISILVQVRRRATEGRRRRVRIGFNCVMYEANESRESPFDSGSCHALRRCRLFDLSYILSEHARLSRGRM
jgi:hypothetical protein